MTGQEIKQKLEENLTISEFAWNDFSSEELGLGPCKEVHHYGGEGKGEHWESVKYFEEHGVYIKVVGYYQSYNGTEFYDGWGGVSVVEPKEKTITVYE